VRKKLCMVQNFLNNIRFNVVRSQDLKETQFNRGHLKYDYEGVSATKMIRLGRYGKSKSLRNLNRNVVSLSSVKRDFSTRESDNFKNLKVYKGKYVNLIEIVADVNFLQNAYQKIKFNYGIMAKRSSEETLDSLNSDWFEKTSNRLLDGSFCFMPVKGSVVSKLNKLALKPLIISNLKNKIVQQAMKMILEHIYESLFLDTSHGFRPLRGCHSALESIQKNWAGISWFLEFDKGKCYDKIDRHRLTSILKEKTDDQRFIDLIFKLFNAGFMNWKEKLGTYSPESVVEDFAVFPILANIYLHNLDVEIARIAKKYQKGKTRRKILGAINIECRKYQKKEFKMFLPEKQAIITSKHKADKCKLGTTFTDWNDPNFVRINYVRYADDLLLGIAGSKDLVLKIRNRILTFAKSNLKLNLMNGKITHIEAGKVKFLGMWISAAPCSKFPQRFRKISEKKKRVKNRLLLQKNVKDERLMKVVRCTLLKVLKDNRTKKNIDFVKIRETVEALKYQISQLPEFSKEWISTYRQFLQALSRTILFVPEHLKKDLDNLEAKILKWEVELGTVDSKKKYNELVGRYGVLPPQIEAPLTEIREKLRQEGLISKSNKPKAIGRFIHISDDFIIKWYTQVGAGLLNYYRCCQNFYKVKDYVNYMVRWSAIHTLAGKHKSSSRKIIAKHTKDLIIKDQEGFIIAKFLNTQKIKTMGRKFLSNVSKNAGDKVFGPILSKIIRTKFLGVECSVNGCYNCEIEWYCVDKFKHLEDAFKKGRRVIGREAFEVVLDQQQIPLCKLHHADLKNKRISLLDINWKYIEAVS
jgi:retron-type reverse transcriptase